MSGGIVARSVVFDELISDFIRKNRIVPSSTSPVVWTLVFTAWIMENYLVQSRSAGDD